MLEAVRYVDLVIPENDWDQKREDVKEYKIDVVVMESDWINNEKFECLRDLCDLVYLPRTEEISTTKIKQDLCINDNKIIINNNLYKNNEKNTIDYFINK